MVQRSGRGGPRPNSGRKSVLGDNERKNARLPTDLVKLATEIGNGNFSDGVRAMLQVARHVLMRPGTEAPVDVFNRYAVLEDGSSALVWRSDDKWVDKTTGAPVSVAFWCGLPLSPAEVSALLTTE